MVDEKGQTERHWVLLVKAWTTTLALSTVLAGACNSTSTPENPGTVEVPSKPVAEHPPEQREPTSTTLEPPIADPSPMTSSEEQPALPFAIRDGGFGCAPFDPIKSQDPCTSAADCAPASHCHARSCVAATNAPPKRTDIRCTMKLVCESIDVGRCDCVDGVCALVSLR